MLTTLVGLLVLLSPHAARDDVKSHFAFAGPLNTLVQGVVAPVSGGLPFTVTLTDAGQKISDGAFALKIPGSDKPLQLNLDDLTFAAGRLTARAKVKNGSGAAVEGVRLDISGAVETYRTMDSQGVEILKERAQSATLTSPLYFGDLNDGEENAALPFDVGVLTFAPETTRIVVRGVVSGLRLTRTYTVSDLIKFNLDVDSKGRIYLAGGAGIKTLDPSSGAVTDFAKEDATSGVAIDRATGDILGIAHNNTIVRYAADGKELARLDAEKNGLDWLTLGLRVDSKGRIYNSGDNQRCIQCISPAGKKIWDGGDPDAGCYNLFDVDDSTNALYAATGANSVVRYDLAGANKRLFAGGNDWNLGKLIDPVSVRVRPVTGEVFILEAGRGEEEDKKLTREEPRISVFSRSGAFVRMWGRGGKSRTADGFPAGFINRAVDLAFGPDGLVYVLTEHMGDNDQLVMAFQQF